MSKNKTQKGAYEAKSGMLAEQCKYAHTTLRVLLDKRKQPPLH